jgi:hypothetical protein
VSASIVDERFGCQRAPRITHFDARLLLHPDRARIASHSRTTARVSPEIRTEKFWISVTPFAQFSPEARKRT